MYKKILSIASVLIFAILCGCASVPMDSLDQDAQRKKFDEPSDGKASIYIFRDSNFGGALKKLVKIDGYAVGNTAPKTYFYVEVSSGSHTVSTESEFGENSVTVDTIKGQSYFVRQYMKPGLIVGGSGLKIVDSLTGQKGVQSCQLALSYFDPS